MIEKDYSASSLELAITRVCESIFLAYENKKSLNSKVLNSSAVKVSDNSHVSHTSRRIVAIKHVTRPRLGVSFPFFSPVHVLFHQSSAVTVSD